MPAASRGDLWHGPVTACINSPGIRPRDGGPVTNTKQRNTPEPNRHLTTVTDAYVASVNAAIANGQDDLARELASEYETEYLAGPPRTEHHTAAGPTRP